MANITVNMAEPPWLTSGSGTPPTGMAPTTIATLTKTYMNMLTLMPSASSRPYWWRAPQRDHRRAQDDQQQ